MKLQCCCHEPVQSLHSQYDRNLTCPHIVMLQILAIFPFLILNPGCSKQRFLKLASRFPSTMGLAAHAISFCPAWLQTIIVRSYAKSLDPHALEATLRLFKRSIVRNAFFLAQHEFKDLAAPADWWLLQYFGEPRL